MITELIDAIKLELKDKKNNEKPTKYCAKKQVKTH
mgnify:CR=1 FL=1|jgi:hypothetical protein|tara:strand:+ start:670 stop:774 length:105 start_codon:yes stop_codon:yes gene_type:complete